MNRFYAEFLRKLVDLSKEYDVVISEGSIEPLSDWVKKGKNFIYTTENQDGVVKITGIEHL